MFISLFYGVIDPIAKEMVFARAGHNPIIVHRSGSNTTSFLSSPGIAIGLEHGDVFENVIVEERTRIGSGDTLVFYTDGLTEGMNSAKEEFGEERLQQIIGKSNDVPAEQLLRLIRDEYKHFCGRQDQHDDLTCIVMKIA